MSSVPQVLPLERLANTKGLFLRNFEAMPEDRFRKISREVLNSNTLQHAENWRNYKMLNAMQTAAITDLQSLCKEADLSMRELMSLCFNEFNYLIITIMGKSIDDYLPMFEIFKRSKASHQNPETASSDASAALGSAAAPIQVTDSPPRPSKNNSTARPRPAVESPAVAAPDNVNSRTRVVSPPTATSRDDLSMVAPSSRYSDRMNHLLETAKVNILRVMAELHALGIEDAPVEYVASLSGYSNKDSKTFKDALTATKNNGLVETDKAAGTVYLTEKGISESPQVTPPTSNQEIQQRLLSMLKKKGRGFPSDTKKAAMFSLLCDGNAHSEKDVASKGGYTNLGSAAFKNFIKLLENLKMVKSVQDPLNEKINMLRLTDIVFPYGRGQASASAAEGTDIVNGNQMSSLKRKAVTHERPNAKRRHVAKPDIATSSNLNQATPPSVINHTRMATRTQKETPLVKKETPLAKTKRLVMEAITDLRRIGVNNAPNKYVLVRSGYSCEATKSYQKAIQELKQEGLIEKGNGKCLCLTAKGAKIQPSTEAAPKTNEEVQDLFLAALQKSKNRNMPPAAKLAAMFDLLRDGKPHLEVDVAKRGNYTCMSSKGVTSFFSVAIEFELLYRPEKGIVQFTENAFPYGRSQRSGRFVSI